MATALLIIGVLLAVGLSVQFGAWAFGAIAGVVRRFSKEERDLRAWEAEDAERDRADPVMAERVKRYMKDL